MITIEIILKILIVGWFISNFTPLSAFIEVLTDLLKITNPLFRMILNTPFNCFKCASFWTGVIAALIFSLQWWIPFVCAFIADVYDRNFNSIKL